MISIIQEMTTIRTYSISELLSLLLLPAIIIITIIMIITHTYIYIFSVLMKIMVEILISGLHRSDMEERNPNRWHIFVARLLNGTASLQEKERLNIVKATRPQAQASISINI